MEKRYINEMNILKYVVCVLYIPIPFGPWPGIVGGLVCMGLNFYNYFSYFNACQALVMSIILLTPCIFPLCFLTYTPAIIWSLCMLFTGYMNFIRRNTEIEWRFPIIGNFAEEICEKLYIKREKHN